MAVAAGVWLAGAGVAPALAGTGTTRVAEAAVPVTDPGANDGIVLISVAVAALAVLIVAIVMYARSHDY